MAGPVRFLPLSAVYVTYSMNYLAHAYLSFHQPALITGNLIADYVKGKQLLQYDAGIQRGIRLHRAIDSFTDQHPLTAEAKTIFRPSLGLYSGVFTDLVYDHFLAADTRRFSERGLADFAAYVYEVIATQQEPLPDSFLHMFHYMRRHNWLYGYRLPAGMLSTFTGITRRAKYLETDPNIPFAAMMEHYELLRRCYEGFFPELERFAQAFLQENVYP